MARSSGLQPIRPSSTSWKARPGPTSYSGLPRRLQAHRPLDRLRRRDGRERLPAPCPVATGREGSSPPPLRRRPGEGAEPGTRPERLRRSRGRRYRARSRADGAVRLLPDARLERQPLRLPPRRLFDPVHARTSHYDRDMDLALGSNDVRYDLKTRPIWLLRGRGRNGRNDFRMGNEGHGFDVARLPGGLNEIDCGQPVQLRTHLANWSYPILVVPCRAGSPCPTIRTASLVAGHSGRRHREGPPSRLIAGWFHASRSGWMAMKFFS